MADRRMIGDILSERRRNLGLSLDRVVNDTKLQRRMVEAFEDSDFDAMPPKGYAQASLASYARYLGLDTNEILRIYDDQLYDFQRDAGLGSHPSSRRRAPARPSEAADYRPPARGRRAPSRDDEWRRDEGPDDAYGRNERRRSDSAYRRDPYRRDADRDGYGRAYREEPRPSERGLYDSGYGRDDRRSTARTVARHDQDRPRGRDTSGYGAPAYRERPSYERMPSDRGSDGRPRFEDEPRRERRGGRGGEYGEARPRGRDTRERGRVRGETQVVSLDDGYQGGSGGPDADLQGRYRPRGSVASDGQRVSLAEVLNGFAHSIVADRRTFAIIVCAVALTLVVVLVVGISSCARGASKDDDGASNIPVTPVSQDAGTAGEAAAGQTAPTTPTIDLAALPANSVLTISVAADAATLPWVEVYVDGGAVYGSTPNPGDVLQFTVALNAEVRIAYGDPTAVLEGITVTVNDVPVTPTLDNGTYSLSMSVAADQLPQDAAATGEGEPAVEGEPAAEGEQQPVA